MLLSDLERWIEGVTARLPLAEAKASSAEARAQAVEAALAALTERVRKLEAMPEPGPAPDPTALNVRDHGAQGSGTVNDQPAVQAVIDRAGAAQAVYLPAGTYRLDSPLTLKSEVVCRGDGPASVLVHAGRRGVQVLAGTTGARLERLKLVGQPGKYTVDGNNGSAVLVEDRTSLVVEECDFEGPGYALFTSREAGSSAWPVLFTNCRVQGWGYAALYLKGGVRVEGCRLVQDDPTLVGMRSRHGIYIYQGRDVTVRDTLIENARGHAVQVYNTDASRSIERVTLERVVMQDCFQGPNVISAGPVLDLVLDGCQILGTYGSGEYALQIERADRMRMTGLTIDGGGIGIWLDRAVRNLVATGTTLRNLSVGIQVGGSPAFSGVSFTGTTFTSCKKNADLKGAAGITVS